MTERPVLAVLVDLDDTLFPQDEWLAGAWAAVGDRADALGLDGASLRSVLVRVAAEGSDRGGIIDRALVGIGVRPEPYVAALVSAFSCYAPSRLTPYPGALAALRRLHATVPVALVTDGNPRVQHGKVDALGVRELVDEVVVSDELGGRLLRKPHPAPFQHALNLLSALRPGLEPADVVHVGDRPAKDVAGARGVGMRCVRVRTGEYAATPDPADLSPWRSTSTFAEAVELLLGLTKSSAARLDREQRGTAARL